MLYTIIMHTITYIMCNDLCEQMHSLYILYFYIKKYIMCKNIQVHIYVRTYLLLYIETTCMHTMSMIFECILLTRRFQRRDREVDSRRCVRWCRDLGWN